MLQNIRGFVYFENKDLEEVKNVFSGFRLDNLNYAFFSGLNRYGEKISFGGIFLSGMIDKKYSSADVINLLRKKMGLGEEIRYCDVSIENEDFMKYILKGELKGDYIGIRIFPPYQHSRIEEVASEIGKITNDTDIFIRGVESENNKPKICIDIITDSNSEDVRRKVESIISSKNLKLGEYTFIKFR